LHDTCHPREEHPRGTHCFARLVEKEQCGVDRRGAFVVVTSSGHREIADVAPDQMAAVRVAGAQ